jgi:hypothetical protein
VQIKGNRLGGSASGEGGGLRAVKGRRVEGAAAAAGVASGEGIGVMGWWAPAPGRRTTWGDGREDRGRSHLPKDEGRHLTILNVGI